MIQRFRLPIDVHVGRTGELVHLANCCMACSGSVSLELLYHRKPAVVLYWVNRWAYRVQGLFRRVRYITLVNLLAAETIDCGGPIDFDPDAAGAESVPYPEYLTCQDKSPHIAAHIVRWLTDAAEMGRRRGQLDSLRKQIARGGASARAAEYLLAHCRPRPTVTRCHRAAVVGTASLPDFAAHRSPTP